MFLASQDDFALFNEMTLSFPDGGSSLDDDFDNAWAHENDDEDTDQPFNEGIETTDSSLEDGPTLDFEN